MREERVRRLLRRAHGPDELGAERRSWAVVRAAYEEADVRPVRRWPVRPLVALAAGLAAFAAAVSPPGQALGGWVREAVTGDGDKRGGLVALPSKGRVLVTSPEGAWIVEADGSKRLLGPYDDATWSPRGLHVAATRGPRLVALTPKGDVRWSLTRRPRVISPRWSPSGFRVSYGAGLALRVVSGDGSPDELLAARVTPGAWAWRPGEAHVLAYADARGRVIVVNTDTRRVLRRTPAGGRVTTLSWSGDGKRLVVGRARGTPVVYGAREGIPMRLTTEPDAIAKAAFAPRGPELAYIGGAPGRRSRVVLVDVDRARTRMLVETPGRYRDLAWSPDGRWLVLTWPEADQWLFVRVRGRHRIVTVSDVSREFDPGGRGAPRFPALEGWCCPSSFRYEASRER